ncbi:hypothetical protein [Chitinimonas sp.]|uniref:hypothetical protein n=1 Tax=Chitinimonas sp. TaxID=1934313 RepID=UPI0035B203B8
MAKAKLMPAEQVGPTFVEATPVAMAEQEVRMREAIDQQEVTVRAVAAKLGYQLPADCTDPDLIQRDIAINMRRSVEACLEVGRGLRVLKEACQHGQFSARLDVLGIEPRVAQRFMATASKFGNTVSPPLLKAIGNQTKLFEMLVLDDEQIEELELTGQTGELTLDDVASMSVKELRAALRKAREDIGLKQRVIDAKEEKLNALDRRLRVSRPWNEQVAAINAEAADYVLGTTECIAKLAEIQGTLPNLQLSDPSAPEDTAKATIALTLHDALNRIASQVGALQHALYAEFSHVIESPRFDMADPMEVA